MSGPNSFRYGRISNRETKKKNCKKTKNNIIYYKNIHQINLLRKYK